MKTITYRRSSKKAGDYFVVLQTADEPDRAEWDAYLDDVEAALRSKGSTVPLFVATDGGGPNGAQRQRLARVLGGGERTAMAHVFSTATFVRAILNAFLWIARERAAAHAPSEFVGVCRTYGIVPSDVLGDFAEAQRGFPPVDALRQIHRAREAPPPSRRY